MIPLGEFGAGIGVARLVLRVTALPVLEAPCVCWDWFPPVKILADKFWCSPIVCQAFGWWRLV